MNAPDALPSPKYQKTEYPRVYLYAGKHKTRYVTFFKGRWVTCVSIEEALSVQARLSTHGKNVHLAEFGARKALETIETAAILKALRCRSKAGQIPMHLTAEDIEALRARSNGFCELTGIEFSDAKPIGKRFRPWMPSVDRIDSRGIYEFKNCRLVCAYANIAINDLGEDEFFKLASMFVQAKKRRDKTSGR
jgi:hypothetical protein